MQEGKNLGGKPPKTPRVRIPRFVHGSVEIPEALRTGKFPEVWSRWLSHRKASNKPYRSAESEKAQLDWCLYHGEAKSIQCIEESIRHGWQGIFEADEKAARQPLFQKPKVADGIP